MSDAEAKLDAFWAQTEAPAQDAVFVTELAFRLARRRAIWRLAAIAAWSMAAGVAAWSFTPLLTAGLAQVGEPLLMALGAASLGFLVSAFSRRRTT